MNHLISVALCFPVAIVLGQVVTDDIAYSIDVDSTWYTNWDTIHWTAMMVNVSQDTIVFEDRTDGHFYDWNLIDSAHTAWDGWVYLDCTTVYIVPPGDSLVDNWPYVLNDSWFSYFPSGLYYGLMRPWFNSDSLEWDTVSFHVFGQLNAAEERLSIPNDYDLRQPSPNPFNAATEIQFLVPERIRVHLAAYDILGREIQTLVYGHRNAGKYSITWNASSLPSGVYLISLKSGEFVETEKVLLLK